MQSPRYPVWLCNAQCWNPRDPLPPVFPPITAPLGSGFRGLRQNTACAVVPLIGLGWAFSPRQRLFGHRVSNSFAIVFHYLHSHCSRFVIVALSIQLHNCHCWLCLSLLDRPWRTFFPFHISRHSTPFFARRNFLVPTF